METSVLSHVTNSLLVVYMLQYLKGTEWYTRLAKALPIAEENVHRIVAVIGAGGSALGMHGAATGSVDAGWSLTLAIPPLWVIFHATWDWIQQILLNQLMFAVTLQQKAAAAVVTAPVPGASALKVTVPLSDLGKVD